MATIFLLLLSVSLISIYIVLDKNMDVCCECPDFVKNTVHSHIQIFEDEALHRESFSSQHRTEIFNDFILSVNPAFMDSYCSEVWQPPKIS